ncbi:E3 ubiquitin-protein ligase TRIM11-like [Solea solea]|uniref:E3 ubiquitin-protein ligase TRIM11-like n=1 Tax=Solea solea TaxID=90069 RepID=UPI00272A5B74|nr:E3 ubiquitin-protein ligase TRIM11-like [Solea solea]XP_058489261.1 E3 ubiquitin-protein ligase TRIM11-like [Solea solea]
MASANISISEKQFKCSICLDVFTEPVTTPCGHNYCKDCITGYWVTKDFCQCPLCTEVFHKTPELRVNTEFRDMLELFNKTRAADDNSSCPAQPGEVPCDLCGEVKCKALKSCLVCLASYCHTHLQPHHTVQALKWHKLINPVGTLEDRMCKKHNKVKEFFCRTDQSPVCTECLRDDHVMHEAGPLEEEFTARKDKLKCRNMNVNFTLDQNRKKYQSIQKSMEQGRQEMEKTKGEIDKAFATLIAFIETKKVILMDLLDKKQTAAEQQAQGLLRHLKVKIEEKQQLRSKLNELLDTEDDFNLLQEPSFISSPSNSKHPSFTAINQSLSLHVETLRTAVAKIEETFSKYIGDIIREVSLVDEEQTVEVPIDAETQGVFDDELGKIQQQYAVKVILDPDTAHPSLILSEDCKQVRDGGTNQTVPYSCARFDTLHFVFGNEGFSSGKFYFEVALKGVTGWEVGVARESISKKVDDLSLSPENGCWTLGLYWGSYQANANPHIILPLSKGPQKIGVFVDYEGSLVSFYDVDTRALLYSFTQCTFTPSTFLKNLLRYYPPTSPNAKVYPVFRAGGEAPLQISPVRCT